mgnify:CR=1 FL=1
MNDCRNWIRRAWAYRIWRRMVPWFVLRWISDHRADTCWANIVMWRLGYDYTVRQWFEIQCNYGSNGRASDKRPYIEQGWCGKHAFTSDGGCYCICPWAAGAPVSAGMSREEALAEARRRLPADGPTRKWTVTLDEDGRMKIIRFMCYALRKDEWIPKASGTLGEGTSWENAFADATALEAAARRAKGEE